MKIINGILSSVLSVIALYLMFIKAQTNQDLIIGFGALLMAIIFICFMIIEEQKEDIEQLRKQLHSRYNNKKNNTYTIKGGDGEIRTRVLLTLTINAYTFRSRFFIPSEIDGSYFDIVTNNCVEFTCNKVVL